MSVCPTCTAPPPPPRALLAASKRLASHRCFLGDATCWLQQITQHTSTPMCTYARSFLEQESNYVVAETQRRSAAADKASGQTTGHPSYTPQEAVSSTSASEPAS